MNIIRWFNDAGNIFSTVSIIIAIGAFIISWKAFSIEKARERDRIKESKKAKITVHRIEDARHSKLLVKNEGEAEAREITMKMDGKPVLEHEIIPEGETEKRFLGPKSHFHYIMTPILAKRSVIDIEITWQDDSDEQGNYRTTIS